MKKAIGMVVAVMILVTFIGPVGAMEQIPPMKKIPCKENMYGGCGNGIGQIISDFTYLAPEEPGIIGDIAQCYAGVDEFGMAMAFCEIEK